MVSIAVVCGVIGYQQLSRAEEILNESSEISRQETASTGKMLQALGSINHSQAILLASTSTTVLATGLAYWFFRRSILRPLSKFTKSASAISRGDYEHRIDFSGIEEFGEIAEAFNQLLDRTETEISTRTRDLDQFFSVSIDLLCIANFEGQFLKANQSFEKTLGWEKEALLSKPFIDFVHPEDREATRAVMERMLETGEQIQLFENRYLHKNGSWRQLSWMAAPVPSMNRVYAAARDVTEQREAERKLKELNSNLEGRAQERAKELAASEERMRLLVEQVQDYAIFMLSPQGFITTWNIGAERIKGYASDEVIGKPYSTFFPEQDVITKLPQTLLDRAERTGSVRHQGWRLRKDGSLFWAEVVLTAIRGDAGDLKGFAKVTRDLTETRNSEIALRNALEEQKKLTDQARAGILAKSEFLAIISHEVRTPMNGIIGNAELLAHSKNLSEENRNFARTVYSSSRSLLRILDDILEFSSGEAGTLKINPMEFSPREVLNDVYELLEPAARDRNVVMKQMISPELPEELMGDAGRLRQILLNIVGNALKFCPDSEVTISVDRQFKSGDRKTLWAFSVQDNGPGIPRNQHTLIFQPFTQGNTTTSRLHGGSGLGLAIAKRLAELMEGSVSLESEPGSGSKFTILLPFDVVEAGPGKKDTGVKVSNFPGSDFAKENPMRILVVEDDPVNLALTQTLLRKLGFDPLSARNGRESIKVFQEEQPECILMDLQMPEMDGFQATTAIRELEKQHNIPSAYIAAVTANTVATDRQRCFEVGMSAYLNKPLRRQKLVDMLTEAKVLHSA